MDIYERFRRIVVVQFDSSTPDEYGLGRTYEGLESEDTFTIVIKAPSFTELKKIYNQLRKIAISNPVSDYYRRIEFRSVIDTPELGFWYSTFQASCKRTGQVLEDG